MDEIVQIILENYKPEISDKKQIDAIKYEYNEELDGYKYIAQILKSTDGYSNIIKGDTIKYYDPEKSKLSPALIVKELKYYIKDGKRQSVSIIIAINIGTKALLQIENGKYYVFKKSTQTDDKMKKWLDDIKKENSNKTSQIAVEEFKELIDNNIDYETIIKKVNKYKYPVLEKYLNTIDNDFFNNTKIMNDNIGPLDPDDFEPLNYILKSACDTNISINKYKKLLNNDLKAIAGEDYETKYTINLPFNEYINTIKLNLANDLNKYKSVKKIIDIKNDLYLPSLKKMTKEYYGNETTYASIYNNMHIFLHENEIKCKSKYQNNHPCTSEEMNNIIIDITGDTAEKILQMQQKILNTMPPRKEKKPIILENEIINNVPENIQNLLKKYITVASDNCLENECILPTYMLNYCNTHFQENRESIITDIMDIIAEYIKIDKMQNLIQLFNFYALNSSRRVTAYKKLPKPFIIVRRQHIQTNLFVNFLNLIYSAKNTYIAESLAFRDFIFILKNNNSYILNQYIDDSHTITINNNISHNIFVAIQNKNNNLLLTQITSAIRADINKMTNHIDIMSSINLYTKKVFNSIANETTNDISHKVNIIVNKLCDDAKTIYTCKYILMEQLYCLADKLQIRNIKMEYKITEHPQIHNLYPFMMLTFDVYGEIFNSKFNTYVPFVISINNIDNMAPCIENYLFLKTKITAEIFCLVHGVNYLGTDETYINTGKMDRIISFLLKISKNKQIYLINTLSNDVIDNFDKLLKNSETYTK